MPNLDDHIARSVEASRASGELRAAPSWGKPLADASAYMQTPEEFRLAFKMLKDAGYVPAEVDMLNELARLRALWRAADPNGAAGMALQRRVLELELKVRLRLESMQASARL